jgi:hypothetical protein
VGYLYDSGFGSTLDQITQRWSDFTPSTPSSPNAEPSAPNSAPQGQDSIPGLTNPYAVGQPMVGRSPNPSTRWNPGLPKITGSYDGIVGGNVGVSTKVGPVVTAGAEVQIGMYTNKNDEGRQELLFGGKATGSLGAAGFTLQGSYGYEYGVDSRLHPVDRPIKEGSIDYRGFDLQHWIWETTIKTPIGNVKIIVDPTPLLRVNPPSGN